MALATSLCLNSEQASDAADFKLASKIQLFLLQRSGQQAEAKASAAPKVAVEEEVLSGLSEGDLEFFLTC
ncbi:hypothetical protein AV530_018707 [Patagioenas fasciata monilis]|uniref:Uncharacterized protein n=1 Tax=Patagioenas fasciata monilis TaxID=372326 RepID=A0A1V4JJ86_PATFA|nr:hypothetical protein AV530_018707 [Patagioenas fasciata monilis]